MTGFHKSCLHILKGTTVQLKNGKHLVLALELRSVCARDVIYGEYSILSTVSIFLQQTKNPNQLSVKMLVNRESMSLAIGSSEVNGTSGTEQEDILPSKLPQITHCIGQRSANNSSHHNTTPVIVK